MYPNDTLDLSFCQIHTFSYFSLFQKSTLRRNHQNSFFHKSAIDPRPTLHRYIRVRIVQLGFLDFKLSLLDQLGLAGAVPPSLGRATNIDAILQAADEIQSEDPNVARILCEQAYSMAQNLDPNSDVLSYFAVLIYQLVFSRHRILKMRKVFSTLRALTEVLSRDADPDGAGRSIREELGRIKRANATLSAELNPYNIVPLEAQSMTNATGVFPERDNVRNQRERLVLTLSNAQSQLSIPGQNDPKIDEKAVNEVFLKVLENYIKWCKYLRMRVVYNKLEAINWVKLLMSVFFRSVSAIIFTM
ncbi:unnamed protein product [Arabis nemorensis]|uniref:Uncharacterized protein n=1 Tax=Arabis nemorensis TaxID=586526 RepID=A0A565BLY3_9BRAS|nr:unnamed protein product [Arabis nemorensis]